MTAKKSTVDQLTIVYVDPRTLIEHPDNPRRGDVNTIAESLIAHGQYRPLIVSEVTGHILAGNHTRRAALQILDGWYPADAVAYPAERVDAARARLQTVAVSYLPGLTPEQEARILAVDNRSADLGSYDDAALVRLLESMEVLAGTGYTDDDLDTLRYITDVEARHVVSNPETDAHFTGTEEEREARAEGVANYQGLKVQGLAEVILVLPESKKEQLLTWLQTLRGKWGIEQTNGELVYVAVGRAVESQQG